MNKRVNFKLIATLVAMVAWLVVPPIVWAAPPYQNGVKSVAPHGNPAILEAINANGAEQLNAVEELTEQMKIIQENQDDMYACLVDRGACSPQGQPDLVPLTFDGNLPLPLPDRDGGLCNIEGDFFIVRVKNQGTARAASSTAGH